jgi:hypothetical protein
MRVIDFQNARLGWLTLDGIQGDWRIIAAAERAGDGIVPDERYGLAPTVMAGDVFGAGRLPLKPAYSYQVFASSDRHVMVRQATAPANAKSDTAAPNCDTFAGLQLHLPVHEAHAYSIDSLRPQQIRSAWPLSMKIELSAPQASGRWSVQCPVNHINSRDGRHSVQVETGPILLPEAWFPGTRAVRLGGFLLAYLFCSRPGEIELLALAGDAGGQRTFSRYERIQNASVVLYGGAPRQEPD